MSEPSVPPVAGTEEVPGQEPGTSAIWLRTIPWAESEGRLKEAYDWQAAVVGEPTEFTQLGSLDPEVVHVRLQLYKVVEGVGSSLTRLERLLAAYVTSRGNGTLHCSSGLEVKLDELHADPDLVARIATEPA